MERKLPVGETVSFCAGFARRNMLLLLRLAWLPVLLSLGGTALILASMGSGALEAATLGTNTYDDPNLGLMGLGYLLSLLGALAFVPAYVVVTRRAAGGYEPPSGLFAGFRFGGREWRVIGAALLWFLLFMAVYFGLTIIIALLTGGIMAATMAGGEPGGAAFAVVGIVSVVAMFATLGFVVFFLVRTMLFIPMAAIENRIALADAWRATKGNFWRLLAVGLLLYLIAFALYIAFFAVAAVVAGVGMGGDIGAGLSGGLGGAAIGVIAVLGLLAIPAYLFLYLLFIAYPGRAAGVLRPMTEETAAAVFD